jgi:hypothetical protein
VFFSAVMSLLPSFWWWGVRLRSNGNGTSGRGNGAPSVCLENSPWTVASLSRYGHGDVPSCRCIQQRGQRLRAQSLRPSWRFDSQWPRIPQEHPRRGQVFLHVPQRAQRRRHFAGQVHPGQRQIGEAVAFRFPHSRQQRLLLRAEWLALEHDDLVRVGLPSFECVAENGHIASGRSRNDWVEECRQGGQWASRPSNFCCAFS